MLVKRAALEKYGRFPTEMRAFEHMLSTRRLIERSGAGLRLDSSVRISHSNRNSLAQLRDKLVNLGYW